ncbi:hypothetical protein K474DRAFT_1667942 [Panus rudis PR-1116 ss-1]|nr:hypothetical protein K474DRAFT_1667942 [Panus rudis PR-1116 ss-1]
MSMSQGFSDLQRAIQDFREDWVIVAAKYNLDAMNAESQKLQAEIDSLTATLASLNAKIRDLWIATGTLMGATGVTTVLGLIMPIFFLGNIVTFLAMGPSVILLKKTQDEYKVKECELDAKKAEHARLMARIAAVEQLKAGLESSEGNFETIIPRLGAFSTVWAAIRADVHAVELKLKLTTNAATWRMMHKRLRTSTALYMALAKALHQYQISVDPDNEIFKANKQA